MQYKNDVDSVHLCGIRQTDLLGFFVYENSSFHLLKYSLQLVDPNMLNYAVF